MVHGASARHVLGGSFREGDVSTVYQVDSRLLVGAGAVTGLFLFSTLSQYRCTRHGQRRPTATQALPLSVSVSDCVS